jgi:phosphoglycolate phosphatase
MTRTLLFDLDGTLVDSIPDLTAALNRLMAARGLAPFAPAEVAPMVGDVAGVLVRRAFSARGRDAGAADIAAYVDDYTAHVDGDTRPYPGVAETLRRLGAEGWRCAVATNKPEAAARKLLAALSLEPFFAAIGGGDSFPVRKPDPGHLLHTLAAAGGAPDRAVMVGDHHNDIAAAAGAGMPCIFAAWGYSARQAGAAAAAVAERFADVPGIAARLVVQRAEAR